ncbi:Destabilase [Popillia japonica]|uniref:lysozyme n=1 Tax=Popillia japonica TaxID=7064 RepID=A0AAW1JDC0_POPJA
MTGCYSLQNCAKYSISYEYWERAIKDETRFSNIVVNPKSYQECITDDNCIINTIMGHAAVLNKKDCLCDEDFDCRDILILHLYGEDCTEKMSRTHRRRYNSCAKRNHKPVLDPNIECIDTSL